MHKHSIDIERTLGLAAFVSLSIWLWLTYIHLPPTAAEARPHMQMVGKSYVLVGSAIIGLTVALLVLLRLDNPRQIRRFFRFSRARLLGALVLFATAPVALFIAMVPILNIYVILVFVPYSLRGAPNATSVKSTSDKIYEVATTSLYEVILFAVCYIISSILVSGIRNKFARLVGFFLVWLAAYSAQTLWRGAYATSL